MEGDTKILYMSAVRDGGPYDRSHRITRHVTSYISLAGLAPRFVQLTIRCFQVSISLCTSRISHHLYMPALEHSFEAAFQLYEFEFIFPSEAIAPEFTECRIRVSFV